MSKLPKLSQTPQPPDNGQPLPEPQQSAAGSDPVRDKPEATEGRGDGFIAIAVGVFLLFFYPRFLQWASHRLFGTHFNPFVDPQGKVVPYSTVPEFWMDIGPVLFGFALVVEGLVVMIKPARPMLRLVLGLTGIATAYNVMYVILSYSRYGFAPVSFLAGAFGIYTCFQLWQQVVPQRRN